jgi:hypothetical protein
MNVKALQNSLWFPAQATYHYLLLTRSNPFTVLSFINVSFQLPLPSCTADNSPPCSGKSEA